MKYIENQLWRQDSSCFVTDHIKQQIYYDDTTSREIFEEYIRPKTEGSPINSDHFQSIITKVFLGFIDGMA